MRKMAVLALQSKYTVYSVSCVEEAIVLLNQPDISVNLVITDIIMPKESGNSLIETITNDYKDIAVLATSGNLASFDYKKLISEKKIYDVLKKPWKKQEAIELIDKALMEQIQDRRVN